VRSWVLHDRLKASSYLYFSSLIYNFLYLARSCFCNLWESQNSNHFSSWLGVIPSLDKHRRSKASRTFSSCSASVRLVLHFVTRDC